MELIYKVSHKIFMIFFTYFMKEVIFKTYNLTRVFKIVINYRVSQTVYALKKQASLKLLGYKISVGR